MSFLLEASPGDGNPYLEKAKALLPLFAQDAPERDRRGGRPTEQVAAIRNAGLLNLLIPTRLGGEGQAWSTVLRIVRAFATVDGSLGHLFGYHALCQVGTRARTDPAHTERILRASAEGGWWWGNSNDPLSPSVVGRREAGGFRLDGVRPFSSGSHVADYLQISWQDADTAERLFAAIPATTPGLVVNDDWNGIGQRQTGSGTVRFDGVFVSDAQRLDFSYRKGAPFKSIGAALSQSILLNVFLGSAQGALLAARDYTLARSRPWRTSGVARHIDDPWIKRRYGELYTRTCAATALADIALASVDAAWAKGENLTEQERGANAVTVAQANVLAGEVGLDVCSAIFEVMGARSATVDQGFDRFWRNVRTHTLHNPAEYKTRTVGSWFLTGAFPEPDIYQ